MKLRRLTHSYINFGILGGTLGMVLSVSGSVWAMGAKGPSVEDHFKADIQNKQQEINLLAQKLNSQPQIFTIPKNASVDDLSKILDQEQQEIDALNTAVTALLQKSRKDELDKETALIGSDTFLATTTYEEHRCDGLNDSMASDPTAVALRDSWAKTCIVNYVQDLGRQLDAEVAQMTIDPELEDRYAYFGLSLTKLPSSGTQSWVQGRYWYPTFGTVDPKDGTPHNLLNIIAPSAGMAEIGCNNSWKAGTNMSNWNHGQGAGAAQASGIDMFRTAQYQLVAMCVTGCFTPDQVLEFQDGKQAIGDAFENKDLQVLALSDDSSLEHLDYKSTQVAAYTVDIAPSWQDIVDIQTLSGKRISVTHSHALLCADGSMRMAQDFHIGESLVQVDGSPDPIVELSHRNYFGKVYNVRLTTDAPLQNIIAAQGLLSGTVYYQNEGTKDLNRSLFRMNLPRNLIQ